MESQGIQLDFNLERTDCADPETFVYEVAIRDLVSAMNSGVAIGDDSVEGRNDAEKELSHEEQHE